MSNANPGEVADRRERLNLFFRQGRPAIFAQLIMGCFLLYLAWTNLVADVFAFATAWFCVLLFVSLLRLRLIERHGGAVATGTAEQATGMETLHARLAGLSGLCWGLVPWFVWRGDQVVMDYLAAAMVFGMAGSATATLAALSGAFSWFVWPAVLPFAVKALLIGGDTYVAAAIIMLFGIAALTHFNRTVHRMIADSIRLRRENADLVARLREEKAAVEEASRGKSLFLAGVSHDLKHPLNALGHYLGYLKVQPDGLARALPGIEQALAGMGGQLSRLLELSRLESGAVQPKRLPTDVVGLLLAACRTVTPSALGKGLRVVPRVPARVELASDERMLQSIFDNLIANAVRYTERGGVLVALRRRGAAWRVEVWDTGPGIPAQRLPLLFDAYRRFDDRSRSADKGFGLGLALARKQCELLGYRIDVGSRPGRGSVFVVEIPDNAGSGSDSGPAGLAPSPDGPD